MNLHWSFLTYSVGWMPRETPHEYIHGNDPISGAPLKDEVFFALTQPLTEAETHPKVVERPQRPRPLEPATEDDLPRTFLENGWTNGPPVVLPTEARVAEMLTGTDRPHPQ